MSLVPVRPYVLTLGETMALMSSPEAGPLAHAAMLRLGIGGSESNVAIGLQRLDVQAVWCGRVGDDSLGQLVVREIRAEGVDVRAAVDGRAPTGLMVKERRTASAQRVTYYRAGCAGSRLAARDVDEDLVRGASVVHLSGITAALSPVAAETLRHVISVARAAGVPVSFDLNYRAALWSGEDAGRAYREILPLTDIVFAGADEAALAVGRPEGEATDEAEGLARRLAALGPRQAVIKLGAEGALALVEGTVYRQPAVPIDVVDTVGAGDAFVAGYLAELVGGLGTEARLATGAQTGAFVCLIPGDWEGLPRRGELGLLRSREPVTR